MDNELAAAANRLLRDINDSFEYPLGEPYNNTDDIVALASAYLATVREDDGEPINEEWLGSIGFSFPTKVRGCEQHCYAPLLPGQATSRLHVGFRADKTPFVYVSAVDLPHIKTRGQLRSLASALSITLKETP